MASPRGARAPGPETQANYQENQPVTFKGGSGWGQHQIPAVPVCPPAHSFQTPGLKTSAFLASSWFPVSDI